MSAEITTPQARAAHALLSLMSANRTLGNDGFVAELEEILLDVAAVAEYVDQQEKNLHQMCVESLASAREISRLQRLIPAAIRDAEQKVMALNEDVGRVCDTFNRERGRLDALRAESVRDFTIHLHSSPRTAAEAS